MNEYNSLAYFSSLNHFVHIICIKAYSSEPTDNNDVGNLTGMLDDGLHKLYLISQVAY
jgi:hypothetical protein